MLPNLLAPLLLPALQFNAAPVQEPPIPFGDPPDLAWTAPWSPEATYDESIPPFDAFLGAPAGSRLAHGTQIRAAFKAWAEMSPRMELFDHGVTHEGRPLYHAVIGSEENIARLDDLLADQQTFADPRLDGAAELIESRPAFAWLGYGIHGDETSAADAAPVVAWHLIAGTSDNVTSILEDVVVVIDPILNPDGRARTIGQVEQMSGYVVDIDHASMQRGRWPYGRGNHYLVDMNRDWIAGVAPATLGRWEAVRRYWPQIFVDGHEMGPLDTFLTYPQAEARHPLLPGTLLDWQSKFADDLGRNFDRFGWGYYTREWADGWGPFYSDAWGSLTGAVGILYEQARSAGKPIQRASGEVVPYREAVHGQFVASISNLRTLARNVDAIRRDYFEARRSTVEEGGERVFVAARDGFNRDRIDRLVGILDGQGIEYQTVSGGSLQQAVDRFGESSDGLELDGGAIVVPLAQPQGRLASAFLDFDTRLPPEYLAREREDLERNGFGNIYDTTAWDLGRALDLECWWAESYTAPESQGGGGGTGSSHPTPKTVAWAIDGRSDRAAGLAAWLMERGVQVKVADRPFTADPIDGGRPVTFARGSLLIATHENDVAPQVESLTSKSALQERIDEAAEVFGIEAKRLRSHRSQDSGPDLGGGHFTLLERPRVAILSNAPVQTDAFGHLWQHLDVELRVPHTMLDAQELGSYDLRRYNVLILPPGDVSGLLSDNAETLVTWIAGGGTLIACGSAAAAVADEELGLSEVRRHRDVLDQVPIYRAQAELALEAGKWNPNGKDLYEDPPMAYGKRLRTATEAENLDGLERHEAWARRFSPSGVILRGLVDEHHWLTFGCGEELPVFYEGAQVLRTLGDAPIRLGNRNILRLAGLLWPEAAERLAFGAWCTAERHGSGQVILFASNPVFRGYWLGTARVFANAVVFGPGLGASAPVPR
ncbi:MAG: M14 family zinc carboxypeptidase [Planctomycetota bacterium]